MKDPKVGKPGVNYYALLGVHSTATQEEITKSFRKKILQVHLDKMGPEDDTEMCYLTIEAHRILSDKALRQKYDVERSSSKDYKAQDEKFIPAGFICYDVGHQQMSRQLLDNITNWTSEYDKCASELSDNYFNCFSQIMAQVMRDENSSGGDECDNRNNGEAGTAQQGRQGPKFQSKCQQQNHFYCPVCDKRYVTETHHWDTVINPYRTMFFSDHQGIAALNAYFRGLIGQSQFDWEVRYLPTRLLGIWGSSEWSMIPKIQQQTESILKQCNYQFRPNSDSDSDSEAVTSSTAVISQLETMLDSTSSKSNNASFTSAQNAFLRRSLTQNLIWVLENRDQTVEQMMSRMNELIMQDDTLEIICLGMAMRNVLKFQSSEWEQLIQDSLTQEQFELSMLWTMLAVESGDKSKRDWFQLGMTIRGMGDAVLAHFCFLMAGCDSPSAWEELANIFTQNGAHYAAIEYHLNRGNLFQLLNKSRALKTVDPESSAIYSGIFYATRIKGLLQVLRKRSRQCFSDTSSNEACTEEMEELIEIIQDLGGNPLEGFRIVVSTWPDVFEETPGYWIHRASIQYLRKGRVNLKSQKLVLAAVHFLPEDEAFQEICRVTREASQLTRSMLERAQETNDFEMLSEVLLHLNKRTLPAAEDYLEEIRPRPPPEKKIESEEETETGEEQESPPPPQAPEPSHKSAMFLLLSGTVHKVNECWLEAMKDYQNALLSAPEVMHRVLPCVSKLVQDISFHEAVVAQAHQELQDLQDSLLKKEYPNVDEYSSDKRRSLILTDVTPKMDYGYKDSVSKIQQDPDKMPPPPPPDEEPMDAPPPPPANTPMVTLDRNQEAIQSGQQDGQMDQLSAALAYVDLLKALPLVMHPGPIVMAASHFLRAMDDNTLPEEIGKLYAYRNAIMLMAENLLRVEKKLQHTIQHTLTHKHMLSILLSAHEKLSKALAKKNDKNLEDTNDAESPCSLPTPNTSNEPANPKDSDNHEADVEDNNNNNTSNNISSNKNNKKDLIRKSDAHVISKLFQNVVNFPKVAPLASIPTLNCSDLVYVETLGNSFLSQFCADKVRQKHQSPLIPKHLHAYTHFVEVWKGRSTLSDFPQARVKAMEELLALKGWTMGDVQGKMMWPFLTLQQDGFSPPVECLLQLRDPFRSYRSMDGFHIDYETGTVSLIMSRDTMNPVDTLFDMYDIQDVVSLCKVGLERLVFSLETPADGGGFSSHPFKEGRFTITGQSGSKAYQQHEHVMSQIPESVLATLSRVSMLLCYLTSGLEMCSEAPFWMRRTDEGLLARLDEHLQHLARPISWRKAEQRERNEKSPFETESVGKFWLNMIEVFEEVEEDEEGQPDNDNDPLAIVQSRQLTYRVGQMRTEVRPNTMVMTLDPKRGKQRLSPEAEFCRDISRHFQEFSRAFPELQRLEELVKISIVCSKLKQVLKENKALLQEFYSKNNNQSSTPHTGADSTGSTNSNKLKAVQRVCSIIESFLTLQNPKQLETNTFSSCNWFPATFCHNMDPDVYDVTVGLELDPVVTYGPVSAPSKSIKVPLEKIIKLGGNAITVHNEEIGAPIGNSIPAVIEEQKVSASSSNSLSKEATDNDIGKVDSEEEKNEDDSSSNNRHLCVVPEESEDDEEDDDEEEDDDDGEKEEIITDDGDEYERSFTGVSGEEEEESISEDEQAESVVEEDILTDEGNDGNEMLVGREENSESDEGSQCEEIDAEEEESEYEEDENEQVEEGESSSDGKGNKDTDIEAEADSDNSDAQQQEEDLPTLTIVIKRPSITSETVEANGDISEGDHDSEKRTNGGENECDENDDDGNFIDEMEYSDDDSENAARQAAKGDIHLDVSVEEEDDAKDGEDDETSYYDVCNEIDGADQELDMDDQNDDLVDGEKNTTCGIDENGDEVQDETSIYSVEESENGDDDQAIQEEGDSENVMTQSDDESFYEEDIEKNEESELLVNESELMEDVSEEEVSLVEGEIKENGDNLKEIENAEDETFENCNDSEIEETELDTANNKPDEIPCLSIRKECNTSPTIHSPLIEGKSALKLRKGCMDTATNNHNPTKCAFLTKRGRLMVKLDSDKVMEKIVSDSLEKTEIDDEDGDLILVEK